MKKISLVGMRFRNPIVDDDYRNTDTQSVSYLAIKCTKISSIDTNYCTEFQDFKSLF